MGPNRNRNGNSILLLLFSTLYLSMSLCSSASGVDPTYNYFYNCLKPHVANPSTILFARTNTTSFSTVLNSYLRNLRFTSSSTLKPLLIITPLTSLHLSAAVTCVRSHNNNTITTTGRTALQIKIRSGGHDFDGLSYVSSDPNFIVLDLFNLRSIHVDIPSNTAYVQGGATLGELYYAIWRKSPVHGFPAGVCPTVGVGGHFSGGGYGNMIRKYGLSVDHIIDAEIVDVNGRILNRKSMGEDLFWAIRGGGGASFGVILSYTVNLVPVPKTVTVFNLERFVKDNITDLVYKWQHVMKDVDKDLFMRLLLQPIYDETESKKQKKRTLSVRVTFISLYLGRANSLVSLLNSVFPELAVKKTDCKEMTWIQSALYWDNYDQPSTPPTVLLNRTYDNNYLKRKSDYVQTPIPKQALELLWKKLVDLGKTGMVFNAYGGVMAEIPSDSTPFPHRAGNLFKIQYSENWHDPGESEDARNLDLIRKLYAFMEPYVSRSPRAAFLNYRDVDIGVNRHGTYQEGKIYGEKYFMANFDRLVRVKTKVDPHDFFHYEQSIPVLFSNV